MGRRAKNKQAAPEPFQQESPRKRKATDEKDGRPAKKLKDASKPKSSKPKDSAPKLKSKKKTAEDSSDAEGWEDIQEQCVLFSS